MCDICGTGYYRSALTRKNGLLYCPDDIKGMDNVEIGNALKAASSGRNYPTSVREGGNFDHQDDPPVDGSQPLPFDGPSGGTPGEGIEDP
jgi:hypothetical protein